MTVIRKLCNSSNRAESTSCSVSNASKRSSSSSIESLHPVVGASDGRGHPDGIQEECIGRGGDSLRAPAATVDAREPASPRVLPKLRAGWRRLTAAHDRLADSTLGDFLATLCFCLTAVLIAVFFLAA